MTDQLQFNPDTEERPGVAPQAESVPQEQAITTDGEYLKRDDAVKLVEQLAAKQFQALQSMQQKQEQRVANEVEKRMQAAVAAGWQPTPEQANKYREETIKQMKSEDQSQSGQTVNPTQPQPQEDDVSPNAIVGAAIEMMRFANVQITKEDPEFQIVKSGTKDPGEFLDSVREAIQAKRERLTRPTGTPASSPSMVMSGGQVPTNSALMQQYQADKSKMRGDVWAITLLQEKYRKLGLNI